MAEFTFSVDVRARPKPGDGHRQVFNNKHRAYAAFREEMKYVVPGAWGRDPIEGPLDVFTKIEIAGKQGQTDPNNLHAGVLDAIQGFVFPDDVMVMKGGYEAIFEADNNRITCVVRELD